MHLSVPFTEIPEHGLQIELSDITWFPEDIVQRTGNVFTELTLSKKGKGKVELCGKMYVTVQLHCDRCLAGFDFTVDSPIQVILEVPDSTHHWHMQDLELGETEIETVILDEPVVEIGDILRQQVLLALPEKRVCRDKCLGLCDRCGINLNEKPCQCEKENVYTPFAVLAEFKKKNK